VPSAVDSVIFVISPDSVASEVCGVDFWPVVPDGGRGSQLLTPIRSQPRWRLTLDDPSLTVERAPYGISVTENRVGGRTFSAPVLTEASYIDVQGADVPTIGNWERLPALTTGLVGNPSSID
jgi:hypothetical protein